MAQDDAKRFPIGRTALGGASCGFTYDGAMQDAVARESGLRRPLRMPGWRATTRPAAFAAALPEEAEPERSTVSSV